MRSFLTILLLFATMTTWAGNITQSEALEKAKAFIISRRAMSAQQKMRLAAKSTQISNSTITAVDQEHFYVFNVGQSNGYVVVSADDRTPAILGYANNGTFNIDAIPENMKAWLQGYANQLEYLANHPSAARAATPEHKAIVPLLKTTWNQGTPYNDKCPLDGNKRSVTGCVATAMAQLMAYYQYPDETTATIPAYVTYSKKITVNSIAPTTINWSKIKNNYTGNESANEKDAIATLMKLCGASIQMDYTATGSSASQSSIASALKTYFNYDAGTTCLDRSDYRANEWDAIIYNELANLRPVGYSGQSTGGGHSFVIDGYDKDGLYHVNWGWGGSSDNYFLLSILDPGSNSGIGASSSADGYSFDQWSTIGIQPNTGVAPMEVVKMSTLDISTEDSVVYKKNNVFHVSYTSQYYNYTGKTYKFDLGVGVFDKDNKPVYTQKLREGTFNHYWGYNAIIYDVDIPTLPDGTYFITNVSREFGNDTWLQDYGGYLNYITATIEGDKMTLKNPSLDLSGNIEVSGNKEVSCKQTATATIKNNGSFFNDVLFLLVDGKEYGGRYFEAATGETLDLTMSFTPKGAGTKEIAIVYKQYEYDEGQDQWLEHYTYIAKTSVDIKNAKANKLALIDGEVLNATQKNINARKAVLQFTATNENSSEYNDEICVQSLANDGSDDYYYYKTTINVPLQLAPGESKTMQVDMPLYEDGFYWFAVVYKSNGEFLDINDNRSISLFRYNVIVPELTPEEVGIAAITKAKAGNDIIYDLQGRRISSGQMKKGIYIINGKKVKR